MRVNGWTIHMTRGDDESFVVSVKNRTFIDTDIIELTMRSETVYGNVVMHKIASITDDGKASFVISHDDTKNMKFGQYNYDIQATLHDVGIKTIVKPSLWFIEEEDTYDDT